MRRRPNAPFKPPRPFGSSSTSEPRPASQTNVNKQDELTLFVPDTPTLPTLQVAPSKRIKLAPTRVRVASNPVNFGSKQADPLLNANSSSSQSSGPSSLQSSSKKYYSVQWRKKSNKKNKSWEGDGYIVVGPDSIVLKIEQKKNFKAVGRTSKVNTEGVIALGMYEAEIDSELSKQEVLLMLGEQPSSPIKSVEKENIPLGFSGKSQKSQLRAPGRPLGMKHGLSDSKAISVKKELSPNDHDKASSDLILPAGGITNEKQVKVDPRLTQVLRPHQREGVEFMYECVMGFKNPDYFGALLADEMGLGKTLMTISLIWTLLKQSPYPNQSSVVKKVLICCPVSLIDNWRKEFKKWLDINRIGILTVNNKQQTSVKDKEDIVNFGKTNVYQVLIMSYEKVLSCAQELSTVKIDFLVCDEGHRLKSGANKTLKVLSDMEIERKLILTGTPIQNDLNEFYTIINFINPDILGSLLEFQRIYLRPILKSRDVNCTNRDVIREGKEKTAELIEVTRSFTLRRTKDVIKNYLTSKTDVVIFCPPSNLQRSLFDVVLGSSEFSSIMNSDTRDVLSMILVLRKICNSPSLVASDSLFEKLRSGSLEKPVTSLENRTSGSKVNVLVPLLLEFQKLGEKAVLVSNFTQTLDFLELVLLKLNILYCRLDGSTPAKLRDKLVVDFNKNQSHLVFLLSAKAGGVGLNLVGASRLVLYDNDWNPLVDAQAMARIHRDGQTRPVFIYRLFTTGAIDEKIFQRQLMKNTLSDKFLDEKAGLALDVFDYEDLRDLFTIGDTNCNTHDLLDCECSGTGDDLHLSQIELELEANDTQEDMELPSSGFMSASEYKDLDGKEAAKKQSIRSALSSYRHFDPKVFDKSMDTGDKIMNGLILNANTVNSVSYVLTHTMKKKAEA